MRLIVKNESRKRESIEMLKMTAASRRKPGMTHAEYLHYLEHVHGAISREKPVGVVRYIQSHVFDGAYGADGDAGYCVPFRDSVTELYFKDVPSLIQTFTDPCVQQKVAADGANFADFTEQLAQLMAEQELPVPSPGTGAIKVMQFVKKSPELSLEDFFSRWSDAHEAEIGASEFLPLVRRCVQSRYIPDGDRITAHFGPKVDRYEGCMSFWLEDESAIAAFRNYQRGMEKRSANGATFMDPRTSFFVCAREVSIFDFT